MIATLNLHPDSRRPAVSRLVVDIERQAAGRVKLRYELSGDIHTLAIPELELPARTDDLWKHTCFEMFVRRTDGAGYFEFNFSPTGRWAAYAFGGYRDGMKDLASVTAAPIGTMAADTRFTLKAELDLAMAEGLDPAADWQIGLAAVIEAADAKMSYWALAHGPGKPDFHHADGFALILPPPGKQ